MRSFRTKISDRRKAFLSLAGQVESQLRQAYDRRHTDFGENQTTLAAKLGVGRSAINKRLTGRVNMTMETIADMFWALGYQISVRAFDPLEEGKNAFLSYPHPVPTAPSTSLPGNFSIDQRKADDTFLVFASTSHSKTIFLDKSGVKRAVMTA